MMVTNEFQFRGQSLVVKLRRHATLEALKAVFRVGILCAAYTAMLLGIVTAFRAQEQQTGAFQINFEYRAF